MYNLSNKLNFILRACLMIFHMEYCAAATQTTFENILVQASKDGHYVVPTYKELNKAETLFRQMFQGDGQAILKQEWDELGFELLSFHENEKYITVLREKENKKQGRGFYAFQKTTNNNALEAPHTFSDINTDKIANKLFLEYKFAACAWSTVPRDQADLTHLSSSYFMAYSRAFALEKPNDYLIQLHGFAQEKRQSAEAKNASIVLSSGIHYAFSELFKMGACLKQQVNPEVRIYPVDIRELGATTNSIGKMFRTMNNGNFIHIELSTHLRRSLLEKPDLLKKLNGCFP